MQIPEGYILISKVEYEQLQKQIALLMARVKELEEEIRLLKNGRKSNTSSTPPSQDIGRSNSKSLREPSLRKPGGQEGHEGSTLQMRENPDKIVEHRPKYCKQCGGELAKAESTMVSRKQEIDLPPIIPLCIEHQSFSCQCPKCGSVTTAELPEHLTANIQYSAQVSAWVAYLSVRQYMPYKRIAEFFNDCCHLPLSVGTIDNMLGDLAQKAQTVYHSLRQRVGQAQVVGGDETGIKINGKKGWLFTFQTPLLTFLTVSLSRGYETITSLFKNGFPISVYVTDCLPAQLKVHAKAHQICIAHLLRELNNFIDTFKCQWSVQLKQLFKQAIELKSQMKVQDYLLPSEKVIHIQQQLNEILLADTTDKHKKVRTFIKRLNKNHDSILTFLYHPKVPPDNNGSERAIRTAKVKMKVSNQFRALVGAQRFAVLRSFIDTAIKNSQNVFNALSILANLPAE